MGEKKKNLNFPDPVEFEGGAQTGIVSLILTGKYTFEYDGKGLQTSTTGGHRTTWYAYRIKSPDGKVIGEYHIHPNGRGRFASGNLRFWTSTPSAFDTQAKRDYGIAVIGRATDWQWLCDYLIRTYGAP